MRVLMLAILFSLFLLASCSKESACTSVPPSAEDAAMQRYNSENFINATKHPSGLYYEIVNPGTAKKPTINSRLYVKYKGNRLDGVVFDEATNPGTTGFYLSSLVQGWQIALPMIGKGGKILITVPSSLGYGCVGASNADTTKNIPPNSPIFFEIELEDFL